MSKLTQNHPRRRSRPRSRGYARPRDSQWASDTERHGRRAADVADARASPGGQRGREVDDAANG